MNFENTLIEFINEEGRNPGQIYSESLKLQEKGISPLKRGNLYNWVSGKSKRARLWTDILKIAIILRLNETKTNILLRASGHSTVEELRLESTRENTSKEERRVLKIWLDNQKIESIKKPFQLGQNPPIFVGRGKELRTILQTFHSKEGSQVVLIHGMPGVGKTMLAIKAGYRLREKFADGILFVNLRSGNAMSALQNIGEAYGYHGINSYYNIGSRSSKIREILASKNALIILDDATNDQEIFPLLPPSGPCRVLITSRRLDLKVADFAKCLPLQPFNINGLESLTLFSEILTSSRVNRERQELAEISNLVGHLPICVDIIAHKLKQTEKIGISADGFLKRFRGNRTTFEILSRNNQNIIQELFDVTYLDLTLVQQQVFSNLSVLSNSEFSLTDVKAICHLPETEVEDCIQTLINFSLLHHRKGQNFILHQLVFEYSESKPKSLHTFQLAIDYFVSNIGTHSQDWDFLDKQAPHIWRMLEKAIVYDNIKLLVREIDGWFEYCRSRGILARLQPFLEKFISHIKETEYSQNTGSILTLQGMIARRFGNYELALQYYHEAQIYFDNFPRQKAKLFTLVGALYQRQALYEEAEKFYREGLKLAEEIEDDHRAVSLKINLALLKKSSGDLFLAKKLYAKVLDSFDKGHGSITQRIGALHNYGDLMLTMGDVNVAERFLEEALDLAISKNDLEKKCILLGNLGLARCKRGHFAHAQKYFQEGLNTAENARLRQQIGRAYANFGLLHFLMRDYDKSNLAYKDALTVLIDTGAIADVCTVHYQWGDNFRLQKRFSDALVQLDECELQAVTYGLKNELALCKFSKAKIAYERGNIVKAKKLSEESLKLFAALNHPLKDEVDLWIYNLPS